MMIDEQLDVALAQRAAAEGVSKAELLRSMARERLFSATLTHEDPVWKLHGTSSDADLVGDNFAATVSEHVDEILYGQSQVE